MERDVLTLANIENVIGTQGNDIFIGDINANSLFGGDGNDQFNITANNGQGDIIDGGNGVNRISVDFRDTPDDVDLRDTVFTNINVVDFAFNFTASNSISLNAEQLLTVDAVRVFNRDALTELQLNVYACLLYTSPSPRDKRQSRMPSSA